MALHAQLSSIDSDPADIAERLRSAVEATGPMVVAFSGGVDSSLLAVAARKILGKDGVLAVTADSESLADGELERCEQITTSWDITWQAVSTDELSDDRYVSNDRDRCYWCKSALMDQLEPIAREHNGVITLGVNLDDLGDHRPGQQAAQERGACFPMVDAKLTKPDVRALAKHWGISTWDRPAMPCLSSRLPYGTQVTVSLLSKVDRAESALRKLGFEDVRVRHYGDTARIELPADQLVHAAEQGDKIVQAVEKVGYRYITLDLAGLRSGNLNSSINNESSVHRG